MPRLFTLNYRKLFFFALLLFSSSMGHGPLGAEKAADEKEATSKKPGKGEKVAKKDHTMALLFSSSDYDKLDDYYQSKEFKDAPREKQGELAQDRFRLMKWKRFHRQLRLTIAENLFRLIAFPILLWQVPKLLLWINLKIVAYFKSFDDYTSQATINTIQSLRRNKEESALGLVMRGVYGLHRFFAFFGASFLSDRLLRAVVIFFERNYDNPPLGMGQNRQPPNYTDQQWYEEGYLPCWTRGMNFFVNQGFYAAAGQLFLPESPIPNSTLGGILYAVFPIGFVLWGYFKWVTNTMYGGIIKPAMMLAKGTKPVDPLGEAQLAYIAIRHEMKAADPAWCISIEEKLKEAYRVPTPEKIEKTMEYVFLVIDTYHATTLRTYLPEFKNTQEIDDYYEAHLEEKLEKAYQYYNEGIKEQLMWSVDNVLTGKQQRPILLSGPPGAGKTYAVHSYKGVIQIKDVLEGALVQLNLVGCTVDQFIGTKEDPGILVRAYVQSYRRTGKPTIIEFYDEIDKVISDTSTHGNDMGTFLLTLLDTTNSGKVFLPYFNVYVDAPKVRILAANKPADSLAKSMLWLALLDRCQEVKLTGYSPDNKVRMAIEIYLPKACKQLSVNIDELTDEDYKEIERRIRAIQEPGARRIENTVYLYMRMRDRIRRKKTKAQEIVKKKPNKSFLSKLGVT